MFLSTWPWKRGMYGMYHHIGRKHLHRDLSQVRFSLQRARSRTVRAQEALAGFEGKRLMCEDAFGNKK
jgi:hypothetical protein